MKRIVKGKRYDTDTAELIACKDLVGYKGALYQTKSGIFFITENYGPHDTLDPVDDDQAYWWLEKYNRVEAIEKYFSDRITDA